MKQTEITKVTLTKEDIINCIELKLKQLGLQSVNQIRINVGAIKEDSFYESPGYPSYDVTTTTIECKKYNDANNS